MARETRRTKDALIIKKADTYFVDPELSFKVILVGDAGAGKTSLVKRIISDDFDESYSSTIGGDFMNANYYINDTKVKLQLWDTCGHEQYRSLVRLYFKNTDAAIVTYDLTAADPMESINAWHKEVKENTLPNTLAYLVGTKSDLGKKSSAAALVKEAVKEKDFQRLFETSAKTSAGVKEMLNEILKQLYNSAQTSHRKQEQNERHIQIAAISAKLPQKKKGCC